MNTPIRFASILALLIALAACNPGGGSNDPSQQELLEYGDTAADEFVQTGDELGFQESFNAGFANAGAVTPAGLSAAALPAGCRTITAGANTDTDGDGIPDDMTLTFDPTKCVKTGPFGGTISKGGSIRFQDNSATPDRAHTTTLTGMGFTETRPNGVVVNVTRNGTRNITQVGTTSLTRIASITGTYTHTNRPVITWTNNLTWTYQAAGAGVIGNVGTPLPQGGVTVNGPISFTRNGVLRQFTVSTVSALNYDPGCPNRVFVGGTVRLVGANKTVEIIFNACGANPPRTINVIP
jgi:hypothetical protein